MEILNNICEIGVVDHWIANFVSEIVTLYEKPKNVATKTGLHSQLLLGTILGVFFFRQFFVKLYCYVYLLYIVN